MSNKKTFREKLADDKDFPRVQDIPPGMARTLGEGTIVIPAPSEVDAIMRKVRKGKLITINQIREIVAERHGATVGCPIATGILARIAAGAAGEDEADGKKRITPYWRTLKGKGMLNEKYPGGVEQQRERLESEGHKVVAKGTQFVVENYEKALIQQQALF
jgi:alkylated DNA nucleotide flippase Atl1